MAQGDLRNEERRAGDVVVRLLQAHRVEPRDVIGMDGMYDLDVLDREGDVLASVEVTIIANEAVRTTWNEKTLGPHRTGAGLQHGWSVTFSKMETVKLKNRPKVHAQLLALEAEGIDHLDVAGSPSGDVGDEHYEHPVQAELENLGVFGVDVVSRLLPGSILLSSINADTLSWTALEDAIEVRAAEKASQLSKAAPDVERILFAWIDLSRQDLIAQLDRWAREPFGFPPRTMKLRDVVDTVIIGALVNEAEANNRFYRWPGLSPLVP